MPPISEPIGIVPHKRQRPRPASGGRLATVGFGAREQPAPQRHGNPDRDRADDDQNNRHETMPRDAPGLCAVEEGKGVVRNDRQS